MKLLVVPNTSNSCYTRLKIADILVFIIFNAFRNIYKLYCLPNKCNFYNNYSLTISSLFENKMPYV